MMFCLNSHKNKEVKKIGDRFRNWRDQNPHRHIPEQLWDCALELAYRYSIADVAKAIGFSVSYIKRKLKAQKRSQEFAVVIPQASTANTIQMDIQSPNDIVIKLSCSPDQAFSIISMLFKEKNLCSK
jgi:hypothetical protein